MHIAPTSIGDLPPMRKRKENRVRTTITIDPEVLEIFKRMAASARISVGRAIGDWCADTADGAQFVAAKMEQARKEPQLVMREMQASAAGLLAEIEQAGREVAEARRGHPRGGRGGRK
jgi:hypothetical protein